jgi:hypothetical protein
MAAKNVFFEYHIKKFWKFKSFLIDEPKPTLD